MTHCPNCGAGVNVRCRYCITGNLFCTPTDTLFERKRGRHCEAKCLLCGMVANPPEKALPLVATRRLRDMGAR